jgi:hypothetical protein
MPPYSPGAPQGPAGRGAVSDRALMLQTLIVGVVVVAVLGGALLLVAARRDRMQDRYGRAGVSRRWLMEHDRDQES